MRLLWSHGSKQESRSRWAEHKSDSKRLAISDAHSLSQVTSDYELTTIWRRDRHSCCHGITYVARNCCYLISCFAVSPFEYVRVQCCIITIYQLSLLRFDFICIRFEWIIMWSVRFILSNLNDDIKFKFILFLHSFQSFACCVWIVYEHLVATFFSYRSFRRFEKICVYSGCYWRLKKCAMQPPCDIEFNILIQCLISCRPVQAGLLKYSHIKSR